MRTECPDCGSDELYVHTPATGGASEFRCANCPWSSADDTTVVLDGILSEDPDPDPEGPTMTDTTEPAVLVRSDPQEKITARTADATARLILRASRNPMTNAFVQKAKKAEGTGVVGLYLEAVAHTATGSPFTHMKFFVVGANLYVYSRSAGDTRANWRSRTTPSLEAALKAVQVTVDKPSVKVFGHPVLVELTADDVSAVESGALPPARFRGQYRIERDYGRYDFVMEVVSAPIPGSLVDALRKSAAPAPAF